MTDNSLDSLLAWMQDTPRTFGSDVILAISAAWLNQALRTLHTLRLSAEDSPAVPVLEVPIADTSFTHYLSGLRFAAPQLQVADTSLENPELALSLPLLTGGDILVDSVADTRSIVRLSAWNPDDGLALHMQLTPQNDGRAVRLDLGQASEVQLGMPASPAEQREAGRAVQAWLQGADAAVRQWPLVELPAHDNPLLQVRSLAVRVQRRPGSARAADPQAALLVFVTLAHGEAGGVPGDNSGLRYLLPEAPVRAFQASALIARQLVQRLAMGTAVSQLAGDANVQYQPAQGLAERLVASGGTLRVAATELSSEGFEFRCQAFGLDLAAGDAPLAAQFEASGTRQTGQLSGEVQLELREHGTSQWQRYSAVFKVRVEYQLHLRSEVSARLGMQGQLWMPEALGSLAEVVSGLPQVPEETREQICGFVALSVKRAVLQGLAAGLSLDGPERFLAGVRATERLSLQPETRLLPHDLALFGQPADAAAAWQVVPGEAQVAAGQTLQLSTEPPQADVQWSVFGPPGSVGDPGVINAQGLYRAPPAHAMGAALSQVLVMARPAQGAPGLALLQVIAQALSVNPLIQVCNHGERVSLAAGHGAEGPLSWTLVNPVPGQSGSLEPDPQQGTCTYVAGPRVADTTYVLDEVRVSEEQSGKSQSAYVLVRQASASLVIKPDPDAEPEAGSLQLRAFISGKPQAAQWSLPLGGPGFIDEQGVYQANPTAREAFVLIFARVAMPELDLEFEGHSILPLPLESAPGLLRALAS